MQQIGTRALAAFSSENFDLSYLMIMKKAAGGSKHGIEPDGRGGWEQALPVDVWFESHGRCAGPFYTPFNNQ